MHGRVSVVGAQAYRRGLFRVAFVLALVLASGAARAGGFEIPDNGAEAMGRGAAYVAKASDGTAIYYNPAGLARQRGTHVLVNGNLYLHSFQFQRAGSYPDPEDEATPWGGKKYPVSKNTGGPLLTPFIAMTTDFGYFDRLTIGAGLFSPSTLTNRTFPLNTEGAPAPSRYDFVQSRSSLLYPTLSAGVRVLPWLDLGVSGHLVLASFDETRISYLDFGPEVCRENIQDEEKLKEDFRCDGQSTLVASGTSFAATFGAMARPTPSLAFGLSFRTPTNITADGTLTPKPPLLSPEGTELKAGSATYALQLPWQIRAGGRYIGMDADFELYDLELDVTYEAWGVAQRLGPILTAPDLGAFKNVEAVIQHGYGNTFSVRGGGAYNIDTGEGVVSLRGGAYFDSSATDFKHTRLDYDTLTKVAGTFGVGYKYNAFGFDVAYAAVASVPRTVGVGDGGIRPVNDRAGGRTEGEDNEQLRAVNEGAYSGFTHIIALGMTVSIEGLLGPQRPVRYGNSYEPYVVDASEEKKPEEKKPEEKKPEEEKKSEQKPASDDTTVPTDREDGSEVKKPAAPVTPPPRKEEKPARKRKEWWEESD